MNPSGLIGAVVAGVVGAVAWAMISYFTGYEIGYVAWAIGGLVGFASVAMGGRGQQMAIVGGLIALAAIFSGKLAAVSLAIGQAEEMVAEQIDESVYDELKAESLLFDQLKSEDGYAQFLIDQEYSDAEGPGAVDAEEIESFVATVVPIYEGIRDGLGVAEVGALHAKLQIEHEMKDQSLVDLVREDLSAIDFLFVFLGVATAFGMIRKAEDGETPAGSGGEAEAADGDSEERSGV